MRKSPVPAQSMNMQLYRDFMERTGAFERILADSGIALHRLTNDELAGTKTKVGVIESYCFLQGRNERPVIKDVHLKEGIRIGDDYGQLFTLADVEDLPALCGSRIDYEPYCTDKTRFSIGFATPLGLLLDCNHIVNQYIFIEDAAKTLKQLEKKRLRLQSLSGYSRENAIARDATSDFLNEAISEQRLPVKAHFNVFAWTNKLDEVQEIKNKVSAAMARLDATAKLETDGAAQIWWAGLPGNAGDFPANDTFDTFLEQATCFFNPDTNYRSDSTGIRFGERLYGRPVTVDLFDRPMKNGTITNRNLFVCGGSGGGKSMAMNHMLRTLYEQGTHCVTIDIGGSYKGLCKLVGGPITQSHQYFNYFDRVNKYASITSLIPFASFNPDIFQRFDYTLIGDEDDEPESQIVLLDEGSRVKRIITDIYQNNQSLFTMHPNDFEDVIAELLRFQQFEVEMTKRTRDGGYDLIALKNIGEFPVRFLVECKRHAPARKIGVGIVRSFRDVINTYGANKGIIVTSSYFSPDAEKERLKNKPYMLDFKDHDDVIGWVNKYIN